MSQAARNEAPTGDDAATVAAGSRRLWLRAISGAIAMFLVQPPADLWLFAWLAPLPWLAVVQDDRLPGRHPWRALWASGLLYWLLAIHWLRLPHPATSIGWVALSAYLAVYLPLFLWTARRLVHRWRWPLVPAAAVAWMACEQLRGWVLGGFTFAMLGHTQWRWTTLLQIADTLGAVGLGGIVMAVAAALATVIRRGVRGAIGDLAVAAGLLALALGYGSWRIASEPAATDKQLDVLLVQGSIDTELKHDPDAAADVARHYDDLTIEALATPEHAGRPDLIVWPETMWRWGLLEIHPDEPLDDAVVEQMLGLEPAGIDGAARAERQARCRTMLGQQRLAALAVYAKRYSTCWLVGLDRQVVTPHVPAGVENFNAAVFLDPQGVALACYDKMHPVMFGEYVPLADRFPVLYRLTPLPGGLTPGKAPVVVDVAGFAVAPTICYETALPGAFRSLVRGLAAAGRRPDVIVNLTNDGWFWGSSELDMHLVAAVFRAVEVRTPVVVAANTGFSASIDGSGRLLARGPRRATATLRVTVRPDGRTSPWLVVGTLPIGLCVAIMAAAAAESLVSGRRRAGRGSTEGAARSSLEPP
ncbi:MAG: apolipoprotein N-acyltransferase [Planctomycetia bacterium]|nr:apolipoprotein N-acyltransferase [Planctomycetia bacterium]